MLIQQAHFARAVLGARIARFRQARGRRDVGASAIELAIITAILVGLAVAVLLVVTNVVNQRRAQIQQNNGNIP